MINLDNNATTLPLPEVLDEIVQVMRDRFGNPGSRHGLGRKSRQVLEDCRETLSGLLGASPLELIFTSGGTESNNLAVRGLTRDRIGTIAVSPGQHPSIDQICQELAATGWRIHELPVDSTGRLLTQALPKDCRLVVVLLAHNETGVIQDVQTLAQTCRLRGIPLHVDAVQAVGKIPVDFHRLQAASLSFGAHKFHGPRGIGGLLVREGVSLSPLLKGGHQESGHRPGTESVALIAGMARALQIWSERQPKVSEAIRQMRDSLQSQLLAECSPAVVNGLGPDRLPNTLNISFPGIDGEVLLVALDLAGIACSLGTTCASGSSEPAKILLAMGLAADLYRSAVRFSLSFQNTPEEIDEAARRISRVVSTLRNSSG